MLPNFQHDIMLAKFVALASAVGGLFSLALQAASNSVQWFSLWQTAFSVCGAAATALLALYVKERIDRKRRVQDAANNAHLTDGRTLVERERLLDDRANALFDDVSKFYAERIKQLEATINISQSLSEQKDAVIGQQRELITQQARAIQQLQHS